MFGLILLITSINLIELHPIEQNLIDAVNKERISRGLVALKVDEKLMKGAREHNAHLCRTGSFYHGRGVNENIAMGQSSVENVMSTWMNSGGHKANILGRYTKIGVSAYQNSNGTIYWTQRFE